jgi:anthranilate synthase/aminodeoxychorismate synthase-like glutamine amidotransferase
MKKKTPKILLINNYDSFSWNVFRLLENAGAKVKIHYPNEIEKQDIEEFDGVVISPGPGLPNETPNLLPLVQYVSNCKPLLGVCLGHQAIAMCFGGTLFQMNSILHGDKKSITFVNRNQTLFHSLPHNIEVGLYHSWAINPDTLPACFDITAISDDNIVMAIQHKALPVFGVQFHPESYITSCGKQIIAEFLQICIESNT